MLRTERESVGMSADPAHAISSPSVATTAPYWSSSNPPSSPASGITLIPTNWVADPIRPCRSAGVICIR